MLPPFIKHPQSAIYGILGLLFSSIIALPAKAQISHQDWIYVDYDTQEINYWEELSTPEQKEQYRDWIKYSLINYWGFSETEKYEFLYDFNPVRTSALDRLSSFEYGPYRELIHGDDILLMLPAKDDLQKVYIAQVADNFRMLRGKKPSNIYVIAYQLPESFGKPLAFRLANTISGSTAFSSEYGYVEQGINSKEELGSFLRKTDDIVYAFKIDPRKIYLRGLSGPLILGGRKYPHQKGEKLGVEDIAVLYQADNNAKEQYLAQLEKRGFYKEYLRYRAENPNLLFPLASWKMQGDLDDLKSQLEYVDELLSIGILFSEGYDLKDFRAKLLENIDILESNIAFTEALSSYEKFVPYIKEELEVDPSSVNIGFSLDPSLLYHRLSSEIRNLCSNKQYYKTWYKENLEEPNRQLILASFQYNLENDPIYKSEREDQEINSIETWLLRERSWTSLLAMDDNKQETAGKVLEEWLIEEYDIPKTAIDQAQLSFREDLSKAISQERALLIEIADWIDLNEGGTDWERMALYYNISAYWAGKLSYSFAPDFKKKTQDSAEKRTYEYIVKDAAKLLKEAGYLRQDPEGFDDNLALAVARFRASLGGEEKPIIDDGLMSYLLEDSPLSDTYGELQGFLFSLKNANSYQKGRYDGQLQGTEVGMNLFYTDLVMKLWSFDYEGSAPQSVPGFFSQSKYPLSLVHYKNSELNSATRSWLGFRNEKVGYYQEGSMLAFSHIATRIFNASSNDLRPGKEVEANYSSWRFAHWWNQNYSLVADYEPAYHKLNQIQKWSHLVHWFKEQDLLQFLDQNSLVKVRNLDFTAWYSENPDLKVQVPIKFLNNAKLNEKTECLSIIESEPFFPFKNSSILQHFAGGVSTSTRADVLTKLKTTKPRLWQNSNLDRVGVEYAGTRSGVGQFNTVDGKQFKLNTGDRVVNVSRTSSTEFAESLGDLRGTNGQFFTPKLNRKIGADGKILQSSSKADGPTLDLGNLSSQVNNANKRVSLRLGEGELLSKQRILNQLEINSKGRISNESMIFDNPQVAEAYILPDGQTYLFRLSDSPNFMRLKTTRIPGGQVDAPISPELAIRTASNRQYYLDGTILSPKEAARLKSSHQFVEIWKEGAGGGARARLTNATPAKGGIKKTTFWEDGVAKEVLRTEDAWYISTKTNSSDLSKTIAAADDFLRRQGDEVSGLIFNKESGNTFSFGPKPFQSAQFPKITPLIKKYGAHLDAIVFNNNGKFQFVNDRILSIPQAAKLSTDELVLLARIEKKIASQPKFKELWTRFEIKAADLDRLEAIARRNFNLADSYYAFKEADMKDNIALVDWTSFSPKGQFVLRDLKDPLPRVVDLATDNVESVGLRSSRLKRLLSSDDLIEDAAFKRLYEAEAKPIFEALENIAQQTNAPQVLTKGDLVDPQTIYSYFRGNKVRFYKDDPQDVSLSLDHLAKDLYPDFEHSIYLQTVPEPIDEFPAISQVFEQIQNREIDMVSSLSSREFYSHMRDTSAKQIYLLIRGDDEGLYFSDRKLSYSAIKTRLKRDGQDRPSKDFIYVMTNQEDEVEKTLMESGRFNIVFTQAFTLTDPQSITKALAGVVAMTAAFEASNHQISQKKVDKWIKKYPQLRPILRKTLKVREGVTEIKLGRLHPKELSQLPRKILDKLVGKSQTYRPKEIKSIFFEHQDFEIQQLKREQIPLKSRFRSIPRLKCWNRNNADEKWHHYAYSSPLGSRLYTSLPCSFVYLAG